MPGDGNMRNQAELDSSVRAQATIRTYYLVLAAVPVLLTILNRNWTFQGFGDYDAFYYFGHFIHFPHYQKLQPRYAGERLPWILPGYGLVHLFGPVYGTLVLHWIAFYTSVFSMCFIVSRFSGAQAGFLAAFAMSIHPYFIAANGMDYGTGGCLAYCLLALAMVVRSVFATPRARWLWLCGAGISWAAATYTYPFWALFTPACLLLYWAAKALKDDAPSSFRRKLLDSLAGAAQFAAGGLTLTFALILVHYWIFGAGWLAFQRQSIEMGRFAWGMKVSPWASSSFSVTYADWLVFPGMTAALSMVFLIPQFRRWLVLGSGVGGLLVMNLYFVAIMVIQTIRPGRILQFDYFSIFLVPGAFLALGATIFYFPHRLSQAKFWSVVAIASAVSLAPLARPGLYVKPPVLGALVPAFFLGCALAIRILLPKSRVALIGVAIGMAASSFCLAPAVGGIAWKDHGDWKAATGRVGDAVIMIENRLPRGQYPAFWYSEKSPHNLEFQAIMCAFLAHENSMLRFPEVDRKFGRGQALLLLTDQPSAFAEASGHLALTFLWEREIASGGVTYWVTATEVP